MVLVGCTLLTFFLLGDDHSALLWEGRYRFMPHSNDSDDERDESG
jgi:hypothetical protein